MTTLNPHTLDALNAANIYQEMCNKIKFWMERLDSMEPFRQASNATLDSGKTFNIKLTNDLPEGEVAKHDPNSTPHTLLLSSDYLRGEPTDRRALFVVMMLRHEQRHHEKDGATVDATDKLRLANQNHTATSTDGLAFMNARLDSEIAARFADYRVANEAWQVAQQDGNQALASDIRLNLMADNSLNKAFFKRERELGRPLTETEALSDFRQEVLTFNDGHYLGEFVKNAVTLAPNLDPKQLQEALLHDAAPRHESPSIDPKFTQAVEDLRQRLHGGLHDTLVKAGAAQFADSMIAETAHVCVERGIQADKIGYMGINCEKNTILVAEEKGYKFAVVDAFAAARAEPESRLQESATLLASITEQHEFTQQQQLTQQAERGQHGMSR